MGNECDADLPQQEPVTHVRHVGFRLKCGDQRIGVER